MSDNKGPVETDPTLTPSRAAAISTTAALSGPTAPFTKATGELPERYQIGSRLGAGGMGEVLLATDQQIGRDVAIKRMRVMSPELEARFLREARIQGRLEHPAIVPVHELGADSEGRPFFVMKRVTGTTLADVLAKRTVSRQKLLRAFADVCLAVELAHSRGIVHRDLKPANIMLGDFGEVYVLDWGIARILDEADDAIASTIQASGPDATEIGAVLGTLGYMSPEQLRGQAIDGRSDVFALGCILFEIIGGEPLLPRTLGGLEDAFSTIVRRASTRARLRDMAPELVALCVSATHLDVEQRLASARKLAEGIEEFLDGDRDLAQRKALAETHLTTARKAIASGNGESERATAIREAGRALALDPTAKDATDLVGRLMLEPPREVPLEVERRLSTIADATTRRRSMLVAIFAIGFLAFVPLFAWMGITSSRAIIVFSVAVLANGSLALVVAKRTQPASVALLHASAALSSFVVALIAHLFSPFLVAPAIAAVSVTMFMSDPRLRAAVVIPLGIIAVLGPYALELLHVLPSTTNVAHGDLVLHSAAVHAALPATPIALSLFIATMIALTGLVAKQLGDSVRTSLRSIELQAWHLRQLVAQ